MKNIISVALIPCAFAATAQAMVGEQLSSVKDPYYVDSSIVPGWLQDYFVAIDLWLEGIFWKYIMYGTWYLLVDLIYCEFFPTSLFSVLSSINALLGNTLSDADAKAACKAGFWLWYDSLFYEGQSTQRPFGNID